MFLSSVWELYKKEENDEYTVIKYLQTNSKK